MDHYRRFRLFVCSAVVPLVSMAIPASSQTIQWTRQFGTTGTDTAYAVATAPNAVYSVGMVQNGTFAGSANAGSTDAFVSKLDVDGNVLWSRQFGTAGADEARGVAADASGVYVVGSTGGALQGTSAGSSDAFVRKYNPNGDLLWTRQFGGPADDRASAASVDATGLYVAGFLTGSLPGQTGAGSNDAFVRKYDFGGNELWTRQFGSINDDRALGIAVDSSGIYVAGDTGGALATSIGGRDYFLRKYDASGNAVWTRQFGTSTTDGDGDGGGVAVNSSGVYVTGYTTGAFPGLTKIGGLWDAFVQKFDLNGNPQWTRQFGTSGGDDYGYGIALGPQWVYAAGQANSGVYLWRFDLNGADLGNIMRGTFGTGGYGVATDASAAYITGQVSANQLGQEPLGDSDAFVFKVPHPPLLSGVSDAFTGQAGVAPTTWTALYGSNLSTVTRTWDGAIQGTQLPTALDEVRININGRPATVFFISPIQVNVLAPLDDTTGNVTVTLSNRYGTSPAIQVRKTNTLPAFYAPFGEASGLRVTAVALDGTLVGKVGQDPRVTRAARPGEILQIYATGFGPTVPATPSDLIFQGAPELVTAPKITIGGRDAIFIGKGNLVGPGLYQFNVTVPDLADGDHAIIAESGGNRSLGTVFLSVKR